MGAVGGSIDLGPLDGSKNLHQVLTPSRCKTIEGNYDDSGLGLATPPSSRHHDDMSGDRSRGSLGRPTLERGHSFGAIGQTLLGHKRQLSNTSPDRLMTIPNKTSRASSRNPPVRSPPRVAPSVGPYSFYQDRLGTLVREMVDSLQQCATWKEFVDKQRGRSYLHEEVGSIPHPAAEFLEDPRKHGVPAKTTQPDL